jgi:uncharacterized RDD family membrane protein YckC
MSTGNQTAAPPHGYLSEGSKRRFTLVAGILGAVFFVAQFALPFIVMLLVMMPMMMGSLSTADMDRAAVWQGDLWFVERTVKLDWHDPESSRPSIVLKHVRLTDLSEVGSAVPLSSGEKGEAPALVPIGDRLWIVGAQSVSYYEHGALTVLRGGVRPRRASRPFVQEGHPAVVTTGNHPSLAVLKVADGVADWSARELPLELPPEGGSLRTLQAVAAGERLYLFAELCTEEPEACGISYREVTRKGWVRLVEDGCSCANWTALELIGRPGLVIFQRGGDQRNEVTIAQVAADGPKLEKVPLGKGHSAWTPWHPVSSDKRLLLASQGMPGSLSLIEIAEGRVTRSLERGGGFPFGPHMMLLMALPQALPALLSLILAFVLTIQMRRHRVQDYVFEEERRSFASLWQRALAQLVDLVPLGAGFALPGLFMWRLFSDPESAVDEGRSFPFWIFGLMGAALLCALLVLVVYSYFEGRFGKTPGKWLLRIHVLGTDLRPCGFGRALLRNVLTFVDGFFNFLVGALLVALTENWQRLGDLAARTIVVVDEKTT